MGNNTFCNWLTFQFLTVVKHNHYFIVFASKETLQAVLSTNGRISYATFIINDGEGTRALKFNNLLYFGAGDQRRTFTQATSSNLRTIREELKSIRIDGLIPCLFCNH